MPRCEEAYLPTMQCNACDLSVLSCYFGNKNHIICRYGKSDVDFVTENVVLRIELLRLTIITGLLKENYQLKTATKITITT